ncbi:MAG: hypothetical protein B7X48_07345 [Acidiphilium sp. 34-60-192]|nr:MAG: hypothetical protein B7X48_07345 [Acidiphilium sp. 34-60-192]
MVVERPATLNGEHGAATAVEISAGTEGNLIGMILRDVSRRLNSPSPATIEDSIRAALQSRRWATNQPNLPDAVDTATAIIERHYILEALDHAAGNRKAAAATIGLSRQSLYMKMLRYGLK